MKLNSPTQALLWKCWLRSNLQFVVVTLSVITLLTVLLGLDIMTTEIEARNNGSRAFILGGLFVLWAACPELTYTLRNQLSGIGFVFHKDFSLPVSTAALTFVPLVYLCLLAIIAYLIPALYIWLLFDVAAPSSTILFLVVEATLLACALQWMCVSNLEVWVSWSVMLVLLWLGWLLPAPITAQDNGVIAALPVSAFIIPCLITAMTLVILYFSVRNQRSGEKLIASGDRVTMPGFRKFRASDFLPGLQQPCPTDSALKAMWWRERQLNGFANHAVFAVLLALGSLVSITVLHFFSDNEGPIRTVPLMGWTAIWYLSIYFVTPLLVFDLDHSAKRARVSPFSRTRPIGTAQLATIKVAVMAGSLAFSALVMAATTFILGPAFITDFYPTMLESLADIYSNWNYSGLETLILAILLASFLLSLACIWGATLTWLILLPRKLVWCLAIIPVYGLTLFIVLVTTTVPAELEARAAFVFNQHLWLLLVAAVLSTWYFFNALWKERVLNSRQLMGILLTTGLLWVLFLIYLRQENPFAPENTLVVAVADSLQGLIPLFATALILWTFNRIRHN